MGYTFLYLYVGKNGLSYSKLPICDISRRAHLQQLNGQIFCSIKFSSLLEIPKYIPFSFREYREYRLAKPSSLIQLNVGSKSEQEANTSSERKRAFLELLNSNLKNVRCRTWATSELSGLVRSTIELKAYAANSL